MFLKKVPSSTNSALPKWKPKMADNVTKAGPSYFVMALAEITFQRKKSTSLKVIWEGHKFLQNLHHKFVLCSNGQIDGGDFEKFYGLLRINELYLFGCQVKN